ncbi:GNAT family N-acetyltransferase [Phycobacter azelaicus]|uniref:GNAT family N-acetyltransferase n=1 Tax=Phycobacter azelaicus TaxID=2668075 RepID=UPI001866DEE5|nr:GNAT family N-acetyltransferase [Phycobacter azelaicus]
MSDIIRQACAEDAQAIADIAGRMIRDTLITFTTEEKSSEAWLATVLERGARFLVAEAKGQVIGYATYAAFRAGPGYRHTAEHSIQLAPTAQGRGVGRALMARLEDVARADDIRVLVAGVSGANAGAVAFHAAIGFREVGRMPNVGRKWGQWLDLVLMQKDLQNPE